MSMVMIPRYVVRPTPAIPPAQSYYVFDQAESPARTVATCAHKVDAELVCGGLELLYALEVTEGALVELGQCPQGQPAPV